MTCPRLPRLTARRALAVGAIGLLAAACVVAWHISPPGHSSLKVMASFWASGDALRHGLDPYAEHPMTPAMTLQGIRIVELNLNPPVLLPLVQLLALADPHDAARLWAILSAALYVAFVALLVRRETPALQVFWALGSQMVVSTLLMGQIYTVMFAAAAAAWLALRQGRTVWAGIALGVLVAMKPNFALALVVLLAAGHGGLALAALSAAGVLSALPVLIYGPGIYALWLAALQGDQHWVFAMDASVAGWLGRLGDRPLGLSLAAATMLVATAVAWRHRPEAREAAALGLLLSVLCSPLAWFHYLIVLVPALLDRRWTLAEALAALLLAFPTLIVLRGDAGGPLGVALMNGYYTFAGLILLAGWLGPRLTVPRPVPAS